MNVTKAMDKCWAALASSQAISIISILLISTYLFGCDRKLTEGNYAPSAKHLSVLDAEARVLRSELADTNVVEKSRNVVKDVLSRYPGRPVAFVHLRMSYDQLSKSLVEKNPALTQISGQDYYGLVDGSRVKPVVPDGVMDVNGLKMFIRQDIVFPVPDHMRQLEVFLDGISLSKFVF